MMKFRYVDLNKPLYEPVPMKVDPLQHLNELLAEDEAEDQVYNQDLVRINQIDAKPDIIHVERTEEIDEMRRELPVYMHEHEVIFRIIHFLFLDS